MPVEAGLDATCLVPNPLSWPARRAAARAPWATGAKRVHVAQKTALGIFLSLATPTSYRYIEGASTTRTSAAASGLSCPGSSGHGVV